MNLILNKHNYITFECDKQKLMQKIANISKSQGRRQRERSLSPKPGKFAIDVEHTTPQPAVNLDSKRKFKFLLIVFKFY